MNRFGLAGALCAMLFLAAASAGATASGRAHWTIPGHADTDRTRAELERTDQVLIRAETHLRDCEGARGRNLLREGRKMQDDAWARFRRHSDSPQEQRRNQAAAARLTRTARDLAVKAIEACQVEFKAHQALVSMLDSTHRLAVEAAETVRASRSADARRLLDAGVRQLGHAGDAYRNRELRRAITLGAAARRLIQRAVQRAEIEAGSGVAERAGSALERTDQIFRDMIVHIDEGDHRASGLLDRARLEQEQALVSYRDGRFGQALRLTQSARRSLLDAMWEAHRQPDGIRVARAIELVERVLQETGPDILQSGSSESVKLLEAAEGHIESAHTFLARGDAARAAQAVRTADSLLRRASEGAGR